MSHRGHAGDHPPEVSPAMDHPCVHINERSRPDHRVDVYRRPIDSDDGPGMPLGS